jgi:hypothetical protein
MRSPASLTRRSVLSLAATTGFLTAVIPPGAASATMAAPPLAPASDIESRLRAIAPGAGIKKVYKDVFQSSSYLDMLLVTDPGGAAKLVTATAGDSNQFQICDAVTGKQEFAATTPTGEKITSKLLWDSAGGIIYAGSGGELIAWSFAGRTLTSLGPVARGATHVGALEIDTEGRIWGGSYPDGITWTYDPSSGKFASYSAFDDRTEYVRAIGIWKDTVFAGTGSQDPHIVSFPQGSPERRTVIPLPDAPGTGFVHRIIVRGDKIFIFAEDSENITRCHVYDPVKSRWGDDLESASYAFSKPSGTAVWRVADALLVRTETKTMTDTVLRPTNIGLTRSLLVTGDRILAAGHHEGEPVVAEYSVRGSSEVRRIRPNVTMGSFAVQSLIGSDHGLLYFGGYQGNGLGSLDPVTDARWRSASTVGISQIEHLMQYDRNRLYIGSYGSAKLYSFDRNRIDEGNAAFDLISTLRKPYMQSRPFAWAAAGGKVLAGTVPEYGLRGGALAVIDPVNNELERVLNKFIPEQSIVGLAGSGDIAYGTTSARGGYGVDDYTGDAGVFAYDARADKTLWVSYLPGHQDMYSPILLDDILYVATINGLLALDPANGVLLETIAVRERAARPGYQSARALRIPGTGKIVHSSGDIALLIDVRDRTQSVLGRTGFGTPLAVMPDGRVFISYQDNHIAEIHTDPNPTIRSYSDLVTIDSAGNLMIAPSDGGGGYGAAVRQGSGWRPDTIQSFHVTDWNGDGVPDILVQRSNGVLELYRGKVNGGFEEPIGVASGWESKTMTVGPWTKGIYPSVVSVNGSGEVRRHPIDASGTVGAGYSIGTGWKDRNVTMIDMGSGRQGLLGRSGTKLYFQPSTGMGPFQGPAAVVASAGWSDTTALSSVQGHFRDNSGLLSVKRSGELQYVSANKTGFAGIISYPMDLRGSLLAGSQRF